MVVKILYHLYINERIIVNLYQNHNVFYLYQRIFVLNDIYLYLNINSL